MSGTAPYEVNVTGTDDETFSFNLPFENADGTDFPFSDYEIEYVVTKGGSQCLALTQDNGITVLAPDVTFKAARGTLPAGEYQHGCRIRHQTTGDEIQVFDGSIIIGEGNF